MPNKSKKEHLKPWSPATYQIEVEGYLDESWSDRLGGVRLSSRSRVDQTTVTTLIGKLRDQAELTGVLNGLAELYLPILTVKNLNENNDSNKEALDPDK